MAATRPPFFWVRYGLYRMGLRHIFGLFAAVVSVSALAADPPVPRSNVSVNLNPTTGYYSTTNSTLRLPNGVSASPSTTVAPAVSRYPAGLQQTIPTGITIDAIKKSAPLPAVVRSTTSSLKGAATRCLTSARCNVGLILAGEGLDRLFNGLDWVMGEGGKIQKITNDYILDSQPIDYFARSQSSCVGYELSNAIYIGMNCPRPTDMRYCRYNQSTGVGAFAGYYNNYCYWLASGQPAPDFGTASPVSVADIESGVADNYNPEPSDWPALTPELELDDVEITSAPTLQGEPVTTTVYDADGNPHKVTETNIWYDFDVRDNPSPRPALDLKTREETKTYENGELTGTTTTTSTSSGGSGDTPPPESEIPTDCDFMPTVCAFLEWFQDDDPPEEPDLSALIDDRDFVESYTIHGGSKQCPPPYELALPFIGQTYYLSFDFACDFASKMYFFVMAAAYIFAAYLSVGVARNG